MRRWAHYLMTRFANQIANQHATPNQMSRDRIERKNTNQSALLATERHRPT